MLRRSMSLAKYAAGSRGTTKKCVYPGYTMAAARARADWKTSILAGYIPSTSTRASAWGGRFSAIQTDWARQGHTKIKIGGGGVFFVRPCSHIYHPPVFLSPIASAFGVPGLLLCRSGPVVPWLAQGGSFPLQQLHFIFSPMST